MVTVSNSTIAKFNTPVDVVVNAATSTTVDGTEVFTVTPSKADYKVAITVENGVGQGALGFSVAAGDYWAGTSALTGSVADGGREVFVLEGAKYKKQDGTLAITLTPAAGKFLASGAGGHAAKVTVVELP
jgi:hydroxymethylglutaryl-CoA reductase